MLRLNHMLRLVSGLILNSRDIDRCVLGRFSLDGW